MRYNSVLKFLTFSEDSANVLLVRIKLTESLTFVHEIILANIYIIQLFISGIHYKS